MDADVTVFPCDDGWYIFSPNPALIDDIGNPVSGAGSTLHYIWGAPDTDLFRALEEKGISTVEVSLVSHGRSAVTTTPA